jgi:hypothetical protein
VKSYYTGRLSGFFFLAIFHVSLVVATSSERRSKERSKKYFEVEIYRTSLQLHPSPIGR